MYGAKRYGVRKGRKRYGKRKGVSNLLKKPVTAITTLAKAVKRLESKEKRKRVFINYTQSYNESISGNTLNVYPLSKISSWTPTFGTTSDDGTANSMIHKSMGIDCYLTLENTVNEPDTTQFTIFLVSLKDQGQAGMFDAATGSMGMINGQHYVVNQGLVMLNKKTFNIHAIKRRVLSNHGTALAQPSAQTQGGTDLRWYWKIRPNCKVTNPIGNWKDLSCPADPSKNYFLCVFSDNGSIDLQNPRFQSVIVHTVEQLS